MKKLIVLLITMLPFFAVGQSLGAFQRITAKSEPEAQQISAGNPWLAGATFGSAFGDGNAIEDNFLFTARLIKDIQVSDRFHVPLMANAALPGITDAALVLNDRAISAGFYPYYFLASKGKANFLVHGAGIYRLLPGQDTAVTQVRLLGGLEGHFFSEDGGLPITASVAPAYTFGDKSFLSLEVDVIFPLSTGIGVLINYVKPFEETLKPVFQAGIVLTTRKE